jgi:membrane protease YdiL (CAAX protease family)
LAFVVPPKSTRGVLARVGVFYLGVLLAGALLAYPMWNLLGGASAAWPFDKVVNRITLFTAVVGLVILILQLNVRDRGVLGLRASAYPDWRRYAFAHFAGGTLVGVAMLVLLVWALLFFDVRISDAEAMTSGRLEEWMLRAVVTGVVVAIWEEILFRGVLFGAFLRHARVWQAAFLSALIYAVLHFTRSRLEIVEPVWWSGLLLQWDALSHVLAWSNLDSFLALFSAGVVLAFLRVWTGSLWAPMGMHAGWVMVIYFSRKVTDDDTQAEWAWLTGNFDQIIGWLGMLGMSIMALKLAWLIRGRLNQRLFDGA